MKEQKLVVIIEDDVVMLYLVDEELFDQLPETIDTWEDAEEVALLIHEKGALQSVLRPDYVLNLNCE